MMIYVSNFDERFSHNARRVTLWIFHETLNLFSPEQSSTRRALHRALVNVLASLVGHPARF